MGDIRFSLCMIVKNEEAVLKDCLDSLQALMDEIIIVDTGSTDHTKEIAAQYTDKIYDFQWCNDFSAARNFAFSKATGDYIYSADADEYIDAENRKKFRLLKQAMLPEIEIVQMIYVTEQINHPTENFARDLRPKLFKRLRQFTWIEPIHETINTNPVVYDSEIEVRHRPQGDHSGRDFAVFSRIIEEKGTLTDRLLTMYLRELYKAGDEATLVRARTFLEKMLEEAAAGNKELLTRQIIAVLLKIYRLSDDAAAMLKTGLRSEITVPSAEVCMEFGYFFLKKEDYPEAAHWFYTAAFESGSEIDIASSGTSPLMALALSYRRYAKSPHIRALPQEEYELEKLRLTQKAAEYEQMARDWKPQENGF